MRLLVLLVILLSAISGCMGLGHVNDPSGPPIPLYCDNPLLMPVRDTSALWEALTSVVTDYFRIESEEPVKAVGDTLTEGRLDTFPSVGSTVLEPWRQDSADAYEKLESTLQSIRRTAHVRVIPSEGGFLVDVAVYKELEDVKRPAHVSAGAATFHTEGSLTRVISPIGEQEVNKGWIGLGRDRALEQRILAHLQESLGVRGLSPLPPAVPASQPATQPGSPSCQPTPSRTQPSSPAPPARCGFGGSNAVGQSRQHTTYRFVVSEGISGYTMPPDAEGGSAFGDAVYPLYDDSETFPLETLPGEKGRVGGGDGLGYDTGDGGLLSSPEKVVTLSDSAGLAETDPMAGGLRSRWRNEFHRVLQNSIQDYRRFYSLSELLALAGGIGLAAAFANTSVDENFQQWHDKRVATHDVRRFAYVAREFGNGKNWLPFWAVCAGAGEAWSGDPALRTVGEWGDRSMRSFFVGGPALLVIQRVAGASRPEDGNGSHWIPFHAANSASGHAFVGAVSFINAAMMTDNVPLKSILYVGSVVPGWSRIVQDKHYISQVVLGWWLAYLSANAVNWTEHSKSDWLMTPTVSDEGVSICFVRSW